MIDKCIPRRDYEIFDCSDKIGTVTSGTYSIGLEYGIGMGYVDNNYNGRDIYINVRDKKYKGIIINTSFISNYSLRN